MYGYYGVPNTFAMPFGPSYAGRAGQVGYQILQWTGPGYAVWRARATDAVEVIAGSGLYAVTLAPTVFATTFDGVMYWDITGVPLAVGVEDVHIFEQPAPLSGMNEMLGMSGKNSGMRDAVYSDGNLINFDLFLYDSAASAANNDGVTGVLFHYECVNTYDVAGNLLASVTQRVT